MNEPDRFQQGEVLSASRLNDSLDYSRGQYASIPEGGTHVFGGQNANASSQKSGAIVILVRATQAFRIQATACDLPDDVPSAPVEFVRHIPQINNFIPNGAGQQDGITGNQYIVPEDQRTFFVYDPVAGLNGSSSKAEGEYFHAVFNHDSGNWEVLSVPEPPLIYGIVNCCLGEGWHEVEITEWNEEPAETVCGTSDSVSVSVSGSGSDEPDECDICTLTDVDTDLACDSGGSVSVSRNTGTGTGEIVYAHTKRLLPMRNGGLISMKKKAPPSSSSSSSVSGSVSDDIISDRLYDVVEGSWPLMSLPFPVFECCTNPDTGVQTVEMTQCNKAIVEGYWCEGPYIGCPEGSSSASESV